MCWSLQVSVVISVFELVVCAYVWRRNEKWDRYIFPILFSVAVVEISEAAQWSLGVAPTIWSGTHYKLTPASKRACAPIDGTNIIGKLPMLAVMLAVDLQFFFIAFYAAGTLKTTTGWRGMFLRLCKVLAIARMAGRFLRVAADQFYQICMIGPGRHSHLIWVLGRYERKGIVGDLEKAIWDHGAIVFMLYALPLVALKHWTPRLAILSGLVMFCFAFIVYPTEPEAKSFWCLFGVHIHFFALVQQRIASQAPLMMVMSTTVLTAASGFIVLLLMFMDTSLFAADASRNAIMPMGVTKDSMLQIASKVKNLRAG